MAFFLLKRGFWTSVCFFTIIIFKVILRAMNIIQGVSDKPTKGAPPFTINNQTK